MERDVVIEQVTEFSPEIFEAIKRLATKIGANYKPLTKTDIAEIIASPNIALFIAKYAEKIVGMVTLIVYRIPYVKKAYVDDLVVDETFRGMGIGRQLMEKVLSTATKKGAAYIDFTARPSRVSNGLYEKLGFKKRDTNVYRYMLDYGEV
jgi:ribosomal protein S18 acetylase RimI-like enzyme